MYLKKFLSVLLSASLILGSLVTSVSAEEEGLISAIEVNQGLSYTVSSTDGTVSLMSNFVARKDTVVFIKLSKEVTVDSEGTKQNLLVKRDGKTVATLNPSSEDGPKNLIRFIPQSADAVGGWVAGSYEFTATIDGETKSRTVEFKERATLKVLAVPVKANYAGDIRETTGKWKTANSFVNRVFPVAEGGIDWELAPELDASDSKFDLKVDTGMANLWQALSDLQVKDHNGKDKYNLIVGFVKDRQGADGTLQGYTYGSPANIVTESDEDMLATVPHEIAHCYDIGDEYSGGTLNPIVNEPPLGMEGKDWNDRDKTYVGKKEYVKGNSEKYGDGSIVSANLHPFEFGGRGLMDDVISYMGSGGKQEFYWTTPVIWDHLFNKLAKESSDGNNSVKSDEATAKSDIIKIMINGSPLMTDVPPVMVGGRTLVPLRAIFEVLGATVQWDAVTNTITGTKDETVISLQVNGTEAHVNNEVKTLDVPAVVYNGRTMVPVRFVSESMSAKVAWDGANSTVKITDSTAAKGRSASKKSTGNEIAGNDTDEEDMVFMIEASGWISKDGSVEVEPWYSYEYEPEAFVRESKKYSLIAKDAAGKELIKNGFDVSFYTSSSEMGELKKAPFDVLLPFPENTDSFDITLEGKVLKTVKVSKNAPTAKFTFESSPSAFSGNKKITWDASDVDGDKLSYELRYSTDGEDWEVVSSEITETSEEIDFEEYPGSDNAQFMLIATDGINSVEVLSDPFKIDFKKPVIMVEDLEEGKDNITFSKEDEIWLETSAYDYQDEWLEAEAIEWKDEEGNVLGDGESIYFEEDEIPVGIHKITITATNSKGLKSELTFKLEVK